MKFIISLLASAVLFSTVIYASPPPPPHPFYQDIGNGMTFHFTPEGYADAGYPFSGVYRNGELIYTINDTFYLYGGGQHQVFFSNDGMTFLEVPLILHPHGIFSSYRIWLVNGRPAVRVFYRGNVVNYHRLPDLINSPNKLHLFVSHVWWDDASSRIHNLENNTLQVTTLENRIITFDLSTGAIVNIQQSATRLVIFELAWIAAASIIILVINYKPGMIDTYLNK